MEDEHSAPSTRECADWDALTAELQSLREAAGEPSYAEIARRISEQRLADGADPHAARVARTTVYDCFRTGRSRVNLPFVREIARALGGDDAQVDGWIASSRAGSPPAVSETPEPTASSDSGQVLLLMIACVGINLAGRVFVDFLDLPIYLDMVGTAVAAIALGPWRGAAVGGTTNILGIATSGPVSLPFALVNIAGALVWGYGVRRFGFGRTLPRFFALNLIVAGVCTVIAVPIILMNSGTTGHGQDSVTASFLTLTHAHSVAVGFANLLISMADKTISGFVALVVVSALPVSLRLGLRLVLVDPPDE